MKKMKKSKKFYWVGMGSVLILLASLLLSSPSEGASSKVVVNQWNIPFINPVTGPAAGYGILFGWCQDQAVNDINAAGGIAGKPLVIEKCDEAMDPTRAASCMKKAATDSLAILGPMTSLSIRVALPIAKSAEVMMAVAYSGVDFIKDGRPWVVTLCRPNEFRSEFDMHNWLEQNPGIKKVVILQLPIIAEWRELAKTHKETLEKKGVEVLEIIDVAQGAVDVSSVIIRALKLKPDGIVTILMASDTIRVVRELQNRGFTNTKRIFIHESADLPELYTMAAQANNALDGCCMGAWAMTPTEPVGKRLLEGFRKLTGQENAQKLAWGGAGYYVATYMVKEAIEKTGVTGDPAKLKEERIKIRDYINSMKDFDSILWGRISVIEGGGFTVPLYFTQIQNSKPVLITSTVRP